ncbi:MAG: DSD1 family PLP-dependent enzyme [Tepidisphaeraceae bacterium]
MLTRNQVPTPALLLDLDKFESNLTRMAALARKSGKGLRPHAKAHKCTRIATRQIAAGANGICVATLAEAELMWRAGISGLLFTSPAADPAKIARIVQTGAMVVVDHVQQAAWYGEAAKIAGRTVDVVIDLDVGDHRTGARPGKQSLAVARAVDQAPSLRLRGIQAYSVRGSHAAAGAERRRVSEEVFGVAVETRDAMARAGLCAEILSGGSTGSADVDLTLKDLTELQAGSYVMMDLAYRRLGVEFANAMTVLTTVVSANHDAFVTVDGGFKAFSTDRSYGPEALDLPESVYRWGGDEFGYVDVEKCDRKPRLGGRIEFLPPHCDPTANLYDRIYACRGEEVEDMWPVMDRMR